MEASFGDRKVFHYFLGSAPGVSIACHLSSSLLELNLGGQRPIVEFDHRQRGILAAFDGTLLWGSLPRRNKSLIYHEYLREHKVSTKQLRKALEAEEEPTYEIVGLGEKVYATVPIYRSVVLLPFNFRMVVRRYDDKSLSPKYVVVTSDTKSVTWLTSS